METTADYATANDLAASRIPMKNAPGIIGGWLAIRSFDEEYEAYFSGLSDGRLSLNRSIPEGADAEYDRGYNAGRSGR